MGLIVLYFLFDERGRGGSFNSTDISDDENADDDFVGSVGLSDGRFVI